MRMSYQRQKEVLEMPNLIEVQKDSYKWFLDEGLKEVFDDISPIADYGGKFSLEFIDFTYDAKDAKYAVLKEMFGSIGTNVSVGDRKSTSELQSR